MAGTRQHFLDVSGRRPELPKTVLRLKHHEERQQNPDDLWAIVQGEASATKDGQAAALRVARREHRNGAVSTHRHRGLKLEGVVNLDNDVASLTPSLRLKLRSSERIPKGSKDTERSSMRSCGVMCGSTEPSILMRIRGNVVKMLFQEPSPPEA